MSFNTTEFFHQEFQQHIQVAHQTQQQLVEDFTKLLQICVESIKNGGKIMFFGNGGSAADAQHLATELTVRYSKDRSPIPAIALTTDTSALTAIGNDLGFDHLFARQIAALGKPQDVVIAISTSGNSENVLLGLKQAKEMGITAAALGGKDGGKMLGLASPILIVPSHVTARIQEMHILLGQSLCGALEQELGLV